MIDAFQNDFGITVLHAWGMTETSPIGTAGRLKPSMDDASEDERRAVSAQARSRGVRSRDEDRGRRGPTICHTTESPSANSKCVAPGFARRISKREESPGHDADGWFATGDIVTIDPDGYVNITDRSKDLIKSGGEWISSIELENVASSHPDIAQAAVIGVPHEKWTERPLLIIVPKADRQPTKESVLAFFESKVAKWWIPEDVVVVDALPLGATGKVQKIKLREQYG